MHHRLPDVGIGVSRQRPQPRLDRIQPLPDRGKAPAVQDPLQLQQLFSRDVGRLVPHRDTGGDIPEGDEILAQFLERLVGVGGLQVGVRVGQRRLLTERDLLQHGEHGFPLGEPLPPAAPELALRLILAEHEEPRHPSVGERQVVQVVEQAGTRQIGEPEDRERPQVMGSKHGLDPAGQGRVGQNGIEVRGDAGGVDAPAGGGDRVVQIREGLFVRERGQLRHHVAQQRERAVGLRLKVLEVGPPGGRSAGIGWRPLNQRISGP